MRRRAGPVKAITDRIAIHLESRPTALQLAALIDRWATDAPDVPHAERHERAGRLLAYAHTSRDLTVIERWREGEPRLRGPEIVARFVEDPPRHAPKRRFAFNAALTALDHGEAEGLVAANLAAFSIRTFDGDLAERDRGATRRRMSSEIAQRSAERLRASAAWQRTWLEGEPIASFTTTVSSNRR